LDGAELSIIERKAIVAPNAVDPRWGAPNRRIQRTARATLVRKRTAAADALMRQAQQHSVPERQCDRGVRL